MLREALSQLEAATRGLLLALVRFYRYWLKPWLGNSCRFEPSCSSYAFEALTRHGSARGSALAGWRILRCSPWCDGGCDPVPAFWTGLRRRPGPDTCSASSSVHQPSTSGGVFTSLLTTEAAAASAEPAPVNRKQA